MLLTLFGVILAILLAQVADPPWLWYVGVAVAVAGALWWIVRWIELRTSEFAVTSMRLIFKVGLIGRYTTELLLAKVESISVTQGLPGRMLNYGDLIVTGTGGALAHPSRPRRDGAALAPRLRHRERDRHAARSRPRPRRDRRGHRRLERADDGPVAGAGRQSRHPRAHGGRPASIAPRRHGALRDGHRRAAGVARRAPGDPDLSRGLGPAHARDGGSARRRRDRLRHGLARRPRRGPRTGGGGGARRGARAGRPRHRALGADVHRARPRARA